MSLSSQKKAWNKKISASIRSNKRSSHARNTDPESSHLAAEENKPRRNHQMFDVLLCLYIDRLDHTSREISESFDLDRYMVARRLPDLAKHGYAIRDKVPDRKCFITDKAACTWIITDLGIEAIQERIEKDLKLENKLINSLIRYGSDKEK